MICSAFTAMLAALTVATTPFFSRFSIEEGLSQSTVQSMCQDEKGVMWFATFDGLNSYDGYCFTVFRHDGNDSTSIAGNTVRRVLCDSNGRIWAGTDNGLALLQEDGSFRNRPVPGGIVRDFEEVSPGKFLVNSAGGLNFFDEGSWTLTKEGIPEHMNRIKVSSIYKSGDKVYLGTKQDGLFFYDGSRFGKVPVPEIKNEILAILKDDGLLWLGTEGGGLYKYDTENGQAEVFCASGGAGAISSNYVRSLCIDDNETLWVGTIDGLNLFNDGKSFKVFRNEPFTDGSLSHNSVRSIYKDIQGGMWLGTYFGGVNYWHPLHNRFRNIKQGPYPHSLNDNIVSCIVEGGDGTLWIGTNSGGLNHYYPKSGLFHNYPIKREGPEATTESNDIKAIHLEGRKVYVGTHAGGLSILDTLSGEVCHVTASPALDIYSLIDAGDGNLLAGTLSGLFLFDKKHLSFSERNGIAGNIKSITCLFRDSNNTLWIGGEDGIRSYPDTSLANPVRNLHWTECIFESSTGELWFAGRNGLVSLSPENGGTQSYSSSNGLPNNIVHGIEEDSFGRLWLSTDHGLSCFNPFSREFRNFSSADGLPGNKFNTYSHCHTRSGEMYFGGLSGITTFVPEKMAENPYSPAPIIRGLTWTGENSVRIEFAVPNYIAGRHNFFSWMLKGYDTQWSKSSSLHSITYMRLPAGRYTFMLKAANNDGKWNDRIVSMDFSIVPEWYRTKAFKVGLVLAILAIIFLIAKMLFDRREISRKLEREKTETRFLINLSHELRSPLTLIISPLENLSARTTDIVMRKELGQIEKNARRVLHIVNQVLEYRRAELGALKLSVQEADVENLIRQNFSYFESLARDKHLRYTFESALDGKELPIDVQYLDIILGNLLSNAFKFTKEGSIAVSAGEIDGTLKISVADTGPGIPKEEREKVFDRFYQGADSHEGSGIGLSLVKTLVEMHHGRLELQSEPGRGSTFIVYLPSTLSSYAQDEIGTRKASDYTGRGILLPEEEDEYTWQSDNDARMIKRGRILVAEDDADIRNFLIKGLSGLYETVGVGNGREALEKMGKEKFDLVVTDLSMPVMDGLKLCSEMKKDSATDSIPVIILSGKADHKNQLDAYKAGANDFISKPFTMTVLETRINNLILSRNKIEDRMRRDASLKPEKVTFNAADEEFIRKAIDTVTANMDNAEFSTADFAAAMNMSRSNLHLKLKAILGESAIEFIRRIRFSEAARLLKDGRYSISQISEMVGYTTPSYFATSFKKYFGVLPSGYAGM